MIVVVCLYLALLAALTGALVQGRGHIRGRAAMWLCLSILALGTVLAVSRL